MVEYDGINMYEVGFMKIAVTGCSGMLGRDVCSALLARGHEVFGLDLPEYDVTDRIGIQQTIRNLHPDAVIHLAAYTAVDRAESEKPQCFAVNTLGARNIAGVCKALDIAMLYTSTDYVFPGTGDEPFETDSPAEPLNHYGKTKYDGEMQAARLCEKLFILRISWTYGHGGDNFVEKIRAAAEGKDEISVVDDQVGSPTYTADLAQLICRMIESGKYGVYHATNEGFCSRADFAVKIFELTGCGVKVNRVKSADFPSGAKRPLNSRLSKKSLIDSGFGTLPSWEDALKRYLG